MAEAWRPFASVHRRRHLGRVVVVAFAAVMVSLLGSAPASAHATLLFTSPIVDGAVPDSPPLVQLVFDQPVVISQSSLAVTSEAGAVQLGEVRTGEDASVVRARIEERLAPGSYLVEWEIVARDGESMVGDFRFVVGSSAGLTSQDNREATAGASVAGVLRWGLFLGLTLALGGLAAARSVGRAWPQTGVTPPAPILLREGVVLGLASTLGLAVLLAGAGSFRSGLDTGRILELTSSAPGRVAFVEVAAFAMALAVLLAGRLNIAGLALLAVPVAEGFRSHAQAQAESVGGPLVAIHLTAVALWVGGLLYAVRAGLVLHRHGHSAVPVVRAYSRMAIVLVPIVFASGIMAATIVLPLDDLRAALLDTSYGGWLVTKLGFVAAIVALAWWARRHLRGSPEAPQPPPVARWELAGLVGVLAISSALTVLTPPVSADVPLTAPPPDVGPAIGLGTRTGYVGVAVSASQGQVVIKLSTPNTSPGADRRPQTAIDLTGNLTVVGGDEQDLEFRRCGLGCFVAPASWQRGVNVVTLLVDDEQWGGGRGAVQVAWPPRAQDRRLRSVVKKMRTIEHLTVHEQVTSDTATGLGPHTRLRLGGEEYLASGPFNSGRAVTVTRYEAHLGGEVTLALSYPAEKIYVLLTVDRQDRIVREVLTSGKHLVTRTLVYDRPASHDGHRHPS